MIEVLISEHETRGLSLPENDKTKFNVSSEGLHCGSDYKLMVPFKQKIFHANKGYAP